MCEGRFFQKIIHTLKTRVRSSQLWEADFPDIVMGKTEDSGAEGRWRNRVDCQGICLVRVACWCQHSQRRQNVGRRGVEENQKLCGGHVMFVKTVRIPRGDVE